ncbi:hypothetical protein [Pedobacter jamesrossensis]|uniref:Uncharacterized protein n=1 Tax=Pedobacter jamesrossensis TaxID=1908238 RepID=A0ABV8NPS5_9SPHI
MAHKTTLTKKLLCIFAIVIISTSVFSQKKAENLIAFEPADKSNISIFIVLKELPGQRFLFTVPEIFTGKNLEKGLFNGDLKPWTIKENQGHRAVKNSKYGYSVNLYLTERSNEYWLTWNIKFTNKSNITLLDLAAFNCLTMDRAPLFKDISMERTWVKDEFDQTISLSSIEKTAGNGRRTMQFYPVIGGIKLAESPWIANWNVNANTILSGKSVWLESIDKSWKIETIVDGQPAFFFNNWEQDHGCIHSAPLIARELKPGQTMEATGSFRFIKIKN